MGKEIAPGGWHQIIDDEMTRIHHETTTFRCSTKLLRILENTVEVENLASGTKETIPADYVVLSMGVRPINHLAAELNGKTIVVTAGDAVKSGTIAGACHSAHEAAMTIR